jgi:hypothetical protein
MIQVINEAGVQLIVTNSPKTVRKLLAENRGATARVLEDY